MDHNHLNKYSKFRETIEETYHRYDTSIKMLFDIIFSGRISVVGLSEVTNEYFVELELFIEDEVAPNVVTCIREGGLVTLFINHDATISEIMEIDVDVKRERDRLQIFNFTVDQFGQSRNMSFINIHGYGLPKIREEYLSNTLSYINTLMVSGSIHSTFICCGDFNSDLDLTLRVAAKIESTLGLQLNVHKNYLPTSYHRYIWSEPDVFTSKPEREWYTKMDQLLYTRDLAVYADQIEPVFFSKTSHPYVFKWDGKFGDIQVPSGWPSDHTFNIYYFSL